MRSNRIVAVLLAAQTLAAAAEPAVPREPKPRQSVEATAAPSAWMGVKLEKPDATVTAHVPMLPSGVGFIVKSVDEAGPAEEAGLKNLDLVWKLGDQLLINEAQLATLLRLSKPGDEIQLSGFRAGKPFQSALKLGEAPVLTPVYTGAMLEAAIMPAEGDGPMRLVNVADKSASFSSREGKAVVWRDGEIFKVKITGPKDQAIFEGDLSREGTAEGLPENWQRRIQILSRTLKQALDGNVIPVRNPRPRVVTPASPSP